MLARFWGTRGSIPVALTAHDIREKIVLALMKADGRRFEDAEAANAFVRDELGFSVSGTYGGHTPCVEIETGTGEYLVCDMGSGARPFGAHVTAKQHGAPATIHILMSHVHWDHIMGFPFFRPAYVPGNTVRIYGCHEVLEQAFRMQQDPPCFPVPLSVMAAKIEFVHIEPDKTFHIGPVAVTASLQLHGGDSYGFRIEHEGKVIVYSTDSEHKVEDQRQTSHVAAFFKDADLVIFDAMYSLAETVSVKEDWGHSSNVFAVELAQAARVKKLALFHHEPVNSDATLDKLLAETRRLEEITNDGHRVMISSAYDGLEIEV
jgi:phosphoribosyl 1,2-cyclic phosphodiesterase